MKKLDKITPLEQDFAKWYTDLITKGNLIQYGSMRGSLFFKPNSYGIWENIQLNFNKELRKYGVKNIYLPTLINESLLQKEKDHVKGFAPELLTVTHAGSKKLVERYFLRPTSEVLFAELFRSEINSYNDLPLKFNQWANIFRWEKTINPFLRTIEFLWHEGHTAFASEKEAQIFTLDMINLYEKFICENLAIATVAGKKTKNERFAGARNTYTIEAMMKDGKALQSGTSHYLHQTFSKVYNITFKNKENKLEYAYQNSFGFSTRLIGALIMTHGDNRGLIIPPKIAPNQVDILELFADKEPLVAQTSKKLEKILSKYFRIRIDCSKKSAGFKAAQSEIEGVPLRIEIGPRDIINNEVTIVRRDNFKKVNVKLKNVKKQVTILLHKIQNDLLKNSQKRLDENTIKTTNFEEFKKEVKNGKFVLVPWFEDTKKERELSKKLEISTRCYPFKQPNEKAKCIYSGRETRKWIIFAKAY